MKRNQTRFILFGFVLSVLIISTALAIVANQFDDFEDGTTKGWGSGAPNPNPPTNITTGGPGGANDNYLRITSIGGAGAGSRLVVINSTQWTGDYVAAGVQSVSMHIKNFGTTTLNMRIALRGPGGDFWSVNPIVLNPSGNWHPIVFSLQDSSLTGGTNLNSTLSGVTSVRILHSVAGGYTGDTIAAQIGVDNITAASQPVPVELVGFSASLNGTLVKLQWATATETNNYGFEVERKIHSQQSAVGNWEKIGFVPGSGNSNSPKEYSFTDKSPTGSTKIKYRLKQIDYDGSYEYSEEAEVDLGSSPSRYELKQNYPNPFNPSTKISWHSSVNSWQTLKIYDVLGNEVATLVDEYKPAGSYKVEFPNAETLHATSLPSGVYFYQLKAGSYVETKKMLLVR